MELQLRVEGMTCQSCVKAIEGRVGDLAGVHTVTVSLEAKAARIIYDPLKVQPNVIQQTIEDTGFDVFSLTPPPTTTIASASKTSVGTPSRQRVLVAVEGMTCQSCVKSIEGRVGDLAGVHSVVVSLQVREEGRQT